jgi:hypothetical protein
MTNDIRREPLKLQVGRGSPKREFRGVISLRSLRSLQFEDPRPANEEVAALAYSIWEPSKRHES